MRLVIACVVVLNNSSSLCQTLNRKAIPAATAVWSFEKELVMPVLTSEEFVLRRVELTVPAGAVIARTTQNGLGIQH